MWGSDEEFDVLNYLYVVIVTNEEQWLCVNWNHKVNMSWILVENGTTEEAEAKKLIKDGCFWNELNELEGTLPPYSFCYAGDGTRVPGFPLEIDRELLEDMKKEETQRRPRARPRKTAVQDDFIDDTPDKETNVSFVPETLDKEQLDDASVVGEKRPRSTGIQEEEERLEEEQSNRFAENQHLTELQTKIEKRVAELFGQFENFNFSIQVKAIGKDAFQVIGKGCCHLCKASIACWIAGGLLISSFLDFQTKAKGNVIRRDPFRNHVCRLSLPSHLSTRLNESVLSAERITELIKLRYGIFLFSLNKTVFREASYRLRHISAAQKLVPVMIANKSFHSMLQVLLLLFSCCLFF